MAHTALCSPRHLIGSANGSALDNGVASAGGGLACLHVLEAAASDAYAFSIEGSGSGAFAGEESSLARFRLEVQVGDNAAPVANDPKYSGEFLIGSYRPQIMTGGAVMFTATLQPATGAAPEWGAVQ